jgi:hypothetical protein
MPSVSRREHDGGFQPSSGMGVQHPGRLTTQACGRARLGRGASGGQVPLKATRGLATSAAEIERPADSIRS